MGPLYTAVSDVVRHANSIDKPTAMRLETEFGLKVSVAMLNACDCVGCEWRYREIYIHSKLLLVDDTFMTVGSANLNIRSMAVDSEINLATVNPPLVSDLRKRIFTSHSNGQIDGGNGGRDDIAETYRIWKKCMSQNQSAKNKGKKMYGLLLPLEAKHSSNIRIG